MGCPKHPPGAPISKGVPLAGGCLEAANARRGTRSRPPTLAWTAQFRTVLATRLEPSSARRSLQCGRTSRQFEEPICGDPPAGLAPQLDFEIRTLGAFVALASIQLALRRLARA
jgi:hypothetical protein